MSASNGMSKHFRTLGVSRDASDEEIQQAYYRLARAHHPDHNYGDPEAADRFKEIQIAYEKLADRIPPPQPQDRHQSPFVVPETPRFPASKYAFTFCASAAISAAAYLGWAQWNLPDAEQSIAPRASTGDLHAESDSFVESEQPKERLQDKSDELPNAPGTYYIPTPANIGNADDDLAESLASVRTEVMQDTVAWDLSTAHITEESHEQGNTDLDLAYQSIASTNEADNSHELGDSTSLTKKRPKRSRRIRDMYTPGALIPTQLEEHIASGQKKKRTLSKPSYELSDLSTEENDFVDLTDRIRLGISKQQSLHSFNFESLDLTKKNSDRRRHGEIPLVDRKDAAVIPKKIADAEQSRKTLMNPEHQIKLHSKKTYPRKSKDLNIARESKPKLPLKLDSYAMDYQKLHALSVGDGSTFIPMKKSSERTPYVFAKPPGKKSYGGLPSFGVPESQSPSYARGFDGNLELKNVYRSPNTHRANLEAPLSRSSSRRAYAGDDKSYSSNGLKNRSADYLRYRTKAVLPGGN